MPLANKTVVSSAGFPSFRSVKSDAAATGVNMMVFAPPGVGKTTLLGDLGRIYPNQVLLFDIDIGRESIRDQEIHFAEPPAYLAAVEAGEPTDGISRQLTWTELRGYLDTALALKDKSPYKVYAFDSLSSIYYELLFPYVENKFPNVREPRQLYFEAQKTLVKFIRDAKSLSEYDIHTFFTGHVKEETDGEITHKRLSLPQGIRNEILLTVNHVGYLDRVKNTETRHLSFTPPRRVEGPKLRQPRSGKQVPLEMDNPTLDKVINMLKEGN